MTRKEISVSVVYILEPTTRSAWRTEYWKNFYRDISVKTRDWEYEKESRMILNSFLDDLSDKKRRTLTYNFNSLKGIIFGIRTSNTDKLEIMKLSEKSVKRTIEEISNFSKLTTITRPGSIQKRNLHLNIFE